MVFHSKYETFWPRFWAAIIDSLVLAPLSWVGSLALGSTTGLIAVVCLAGLLLGPSTYAIVLHRLYGQTVGKALMRVRILDHSERRGIDFRQAFVRESPVVLASALTLYSSAYAAYLGVSSYAWGPGSMELAVWNLWLWLEMATMVFNKRRRALHDLMAGTVVVRTSDRPFSSWRMPTLKMRGSGGADDQHNT